MERNWKVYKHTCPNGKVYIGITGQESVKKRWKNGHGYDTQKFGRAVKKYGWSNIKHEILYTDLTKEEAEQKEIELIAKYKSDDGRYGYNDEKGGNCAGKVSEKTKKKIRKSLMGKYARGKHPLAKKVCCEDMVFDCTKDCAEFYGVKYDTMKQWLNKTNYMPKEWYDKGLRYEDKQMSDYKVYNSEEVGRKISEARKGKFTGEKCYKSKTVICEDKKFVSAKECSEFYGVPHSTIRCWLNRTTPMPKEWYDKGLHYEDIPMNDYEIFNPNKRYENIGIALKNKYDNGYISKTCKAVICDGKRFESVKLFAKEYNLNEKSVGVWLRCDAPMPKEWYDRELRYEDKQMSDYQVQTGKAKGRNNKSSKQVICGGILFETITECAEFYGTKRKNVSNWLSSRINTPQKFKDLDLRYATEEDIQKYPVYIPE